MGLFFIGLYVVRGVSELGRSGRRIDGPACLPYFWLLLFVLSKPSLERWLLLFVKNAGQTDLNSMRGRLG